MGGLAIPHSALELSKHLQDSFLAARSWAGAAPWKGESVD